MSFFRQITVPRNFTKILGATRWITLVAVLCLLIFIWTRSGVASLNFDTDVARDLKQISNIQLGETVWLGPWLGPGLHASSIYYYMLYPFIVLFGGKAVGLVYGNLVIGVIALGYFGFLSTKAYGFRGVIATLLLGTLPLVTENILHPGNGFTYLYFVLMSLSALWLGGSLWVASLTAGLAFALHPVAGFLPLLLLVQWWHTSKKWQVALLNLILFLAPLAPTLAFEAITHGYMTRNFLAQPSSNGISLTYSLENATQAAGLVGTSRIQLLALLFFSYYMVIKKTAKKTMPVFVASVVVFIACLFLQNLIWRYLFGIALMIWFAAVIPLVRRKIALPLLLVLAVISTARSPLFHPYPTAGRTIPEIESIADFIANNAQLDTQTPIAVVAALSHGTEVPQADDYQFLLRNRGFTVTETTDHDKASLLVYIIEVPGFEWEKWSNWEIDSFGGKKLLQVLEYSERVTVVVFEKE